MDLTKLYERPDPVVLPTGSHELKSPSELSQEDLDVLGQLGSDPVGGLDFVFVDGNPGVNSPIVAAQILRHFLGTLPRLSLPPSS